MKERDRLIAMRQQAPGAMVEEAQKKKKRDKSRDRASRSKFARRLLQAGIEVTPKIYVAGVVGAGIVVFYLGSLLGFLLGTVLGAVVTHYLLFGYLEERAVKRKQKIIPQLAPFIDAIASSLSSGFNIEAAIVASAEAIPEGTLRSELDRVVNALNSGFTVRESMGVLRERIVGREITSLAVALSLFATMGGNVLEPFRRLARKLREQQTVAERATRDLVMVKQAFYILFFLALSAPAVLLLVSPEYMNDALKDSFGRIVLQMGAICIVVAYLFFKRITNLRV